ncbi:hypothetical protein [Maribacter dokdonensis]|uniref:hypothetical protein n=1 Tax=Maribacter dokdonensis TaxID=320912 RepID=UPI0007199989|nr:hypothetical protein [Maribacter dokdonensis]KSA14192.1 Tetratricopeptide repeat domain protein [Maribacter dokdonensis DSW-8]
MNKLIILIFTFFYCNFTIAQEDLSSTDQITEVFHQLVSAYGNSKTSPKLKIISTGKQKTPAIYFASPTPTIRVDNNLIQICSQFGKDSSSALSIILSHELAHYYDDHTFCTDFAFAIRKNNTYLSGKLKSLSKNEKLALETEADHKGLFYSCIAGYKPFNIYPKLLDVIYSEYQLSENIEGYPTKQERKDISLVAEIKASKLNTLFLKGLASIKKGDYDGAIDNFKTLNNYFPSRENYNNLGVSRTLKALSFIPINRLSAKYPNRFSYPLALDKISRLNQPSSSRNLYEISNADIIALLKLAQRDFEKAISLDESYTKGYINLACVFELLDNPMASLGKIRELPAKERKSKEALRISAISYYSLDQKDKADAIWKQLKL